MRYDLVLEVMSGRIFTKFDIAPKAQLWPEHFETCSVQYEYRTLQIVYLGFVISLTSGQDNFVTCPLTLARTGLVVLLVQPPPPWGFSRIAKKRRRVAPPGFGLPYGANLAQFLAKKIWPGQVRSRRYDVIRGTTSGNFSNKVVFSRNLTWRHWCKW